MHGYRQHFIRILDPPTRQQILKDNASMFLVARLVAGEYIRGLDGRLRRVITFNVDDLLEEAVYTLLVHF